MCSLLNHNRLLTHYWKGPVVVCLRAFAYRLPDCSHPCLLQSYLSFNVSVQCSLLHKALHDSPCLDVIIFSFEPCYHCTSSIPWFLLALVIMYMTFFLLTRASLLKVWHLDQQHQNHLGVCKKCRLLGPIADLTESELVFLNKIPSNLYVC